MQALLDIRDFSARIGEKQILNGVSLAVAPGEVHFLMGPNGSGKTTLASALMGSPAVAASSGSIIFGGEDITTLPAEERSKKGVYLGFQYPVEVPGVGFSVFLRATLAVRGTPVASEDAFRQDVLAAALRLGVQPGLTDRNLNEGFSGGEKKRSELLQLEILKPRLAILDEFDSGLDVDGLRAAAGVLQRLRQEGRALLLITHYGRMAEYLAPDRVHVMHGGTIVSSGGAELVEAVEREGFEKIIAS